MVSQSCSSIFFVIDTFFSVENYVEAEGVLEVFHHFPKRRQAITKAHVNITSILDVVTKEHLETGAWVNIIGYISAPPHGYNGLAAQAVELPYIHALMVWSADGINLSEYEKALTERQRAKS